MPNASNADQAEFWNAEPGRIWARRQADLDAITEGAARLLLQACASRTGERALDVGCGAGASSFALADAVGPSGKVHGVDISEPLIARAEERRAALGLGHVSFEVADAQERAFGRDFDIVASRFGVMFFADPVAAFRNLRSALRPGGRIAFVAWAGPERNPWFSVPQRIAVARLGAVAPTPPDAPGPMAFRDIDRVCAILAAAGFSDRQGESAGVDLHHPGGIEAVVDLASHVGPTARVMREKNGTEEDRAAILEGIAAALEPYRSADGVRIPACINVFTAVTA